MEKELTLFDRLWNAHVVEHQEDGSDLLAVDRIFLHDLCGTYSFQRMDDKGYKVYHPELVYAMPDHTLSTGFDRLENPAEVSIEYVTQLRKGCEKYGITLFDDGSDRQGIVHIVGPESGLTLPGMLVVCGDSHTCTHGAAGALAIGLGTNEVVHALATSCILARRPKTMEIRLEGTCADGVDSMDIILYIISQYGIDFARGYAVEYTGEAIRSMEVEDRFTICNLTIEMGADTGLISPDDKLITYIEGREFAPAGKAWEAFVQYCRDIASTGESRFDKSVTIDVGKIKRQVSWGINPSHTISVCSDIPVIDSSLPAKAAEGYKKAYDYMGLEPGSPISGIKIDKVFIGSCSNGRLSTIRKAVDAVKGGKVKEGVDAWIVPGSVQVKEEAERLGYIKVLEDAGFHVGNPCCALCVGSNGEMVAPGKRCVSTTNRNFIGRQGVGARTHLASVTTAVLSAIAGKIE